MPTSRFHIPRNGATGLILEFNGPYSEYRTHRSVTSLWLCVSHLPYTNPQTYSYYTTIRQLVQAVLCDLYIFIDCLHRSCATSTTSISSIAPWTANIISTLAARIWFGRIFSKIPPFSSNSEQNCSPLVRKLLRSSRETTDVGFLAHMFMCGVLLHKRKYLVNRLLFCS